jgi:hypothetical protein
VQAWIDMLTVAQPYAKEVWHAKSVKVELEKYIQGDAGLKVESPRISP